MFEAGDVVVQDKTCINGKNYKDNKPYRLNVVLFVIEIDGETYVCTCPITSKPKYNLKNYFYEGYMLLGKDRLSYIKLNSANLYKSKLLHKVNINLGQERMKKIILKMQDINLLEQNEFINTLIKEKIQEIFKEQQILAKEPTKRKYYNQ